jgi:translation initiation factor 2B subunit (eIF-2B alpha/beta/delta family)
VDIVLLGADRISDAGDVSNKTGSLPAVLCAKAVSDRVTIVVVSELDKVAKPGNIDEQVEEDNDVAEVAGIWGQVREGMKPELWDKMVKIKNIYFEWVPAKYIDCYICEIGSVGIKTIKEQSHWVQEAELRLLGDSE